MIKTLSITAILSASSAIAAAAPLPAPPTEIYTAPAQNTCVAETLSVYFPTGTSALTPASRNLLEAAQARLDGCVLGPVSLIATADDARNSRESENLTTARIETVSEALTEYKLDGMRIAAETADASTETLWTPMDRKVEIRVTAWAPEIS